MKNPTVILDAVSVRNLTTGRRITLTRKEAIESALKQNNRPYTFLNAVATDGCQVNIARSK